MPGYEFTFLREVPDEYVCPICDCPMRSPVQTKCGHRFCKVCLEKSFTRKKKLCPLDRSSLNPRSPTDIYLDLAIERTILDFHVKCPHDKNGCKWTGEVRSVEKHEAHCCFIGVKCTNKGCKETPLLKDLQEHLTKECLMRNELCQYCKTSFIFCKGKEHDDKCAKYPVPCTQKCGQPIPRDQMGGHIKETCSCTLVECIYTHVGCSEEVARGALDQHLKENTELHLKMACEKLQEFQDLLEGNIGNVKEIQASVVEADRRIIDLYGTIRQSNMVLEELLQNRVGLLDKVLNDLQREQRDINNKQDVLQFEVDSLNSEVEELEERASNLEDLQQEVASIKRRQSDHYWRLEYLNKRVSNDRAWLEDSVNNRLDDLQAGARCRMESNTYLFTKQEDDLQLLKHEVRVIFFSVIFVILVLGYYLATSTTK